MTHDQTITYQVTPAGLELSAIHGANPLGFLAALGTALTAQTFCPDLKIGWAFAIGAWRPVLMGCGQDRTAFLDNLHRNLSQASMAAFEIDDKLPFPVDQFTQALREAQDNASLTDRRLADFLASFGSEVYPDKGVFQDSAFRMVRSGDSAGQGLPVYARKIRAKTDRATLERTLFTGWDYRDDGFSLRWDPLEDQRYALRWHDPSKSGKDDGPATMIGANSLAIEALPLFPALSQGSRLATTGFFRDSDRRTFFTWPIWDQAISLDSVRALLTLEELHCNQPKRDRLMPRGIVEAYRSQRIAQNQYYSNFTPGSPA